MRRARSMNSRPILVSFSGIDGCGKSTQIEILSDRLRQTGLRVRLFAFWDDVALLKPWREFTSHSVFGSEKGTGSPDCPVDRRDKNVQAWYMIPVRWILYFLDAMSLCNTVVKTEGVEADVIIFDRYLYDELANLPLDRPLTHTYARLLLNLVPQPDIAYWIDANPDEARARKPEYPLEFLRSNRWSYARLSAMAGMTVTDPGSVQSVATLIMRSFLQRFPFTRLPELPLAEGPSE
ncbi:MAG: thymidylate kinase [Terriglobales bacterium]